MDNDTKAVVLFSSMLGFGIGLLIGTIGQGLVIRNEAIKSGHAHYDQVSGELKWGPPVCEK